MVDDDLSKSRLAISQAEWLSRTADCSVIAFRKTPVASATGVFYCLVFSYEAVDLFYSLIVCIVDIYSKLVNKIQENWPNYDKRSFK